MTMTTNPTTTTDNNGNTNPANTNIRNRDLLALRSYVMANDTIQFDNVSKSMVLLDLTHSNLKQKHIEIRFEKHSTLGYLRNKIHQKTGTSPQYQHLQVKQNGTIIHEISPSIPGEQYKLGYFGLLYHGMEVHCIDLNENSGSKNGQYEDTTLIKKYTMSDEEYNSRKGTLRDWSKQQKMKDSNFTLAKHAKQHRELMDAQRQHKLGLELPKGFYLDNNGKIERDDEYEEQEEEQKKKKTVTTSSSSSSNDNECSKESIISNIKIGMRCEVQPGSRRGVVSYVGEVVELSSQGEYWIGVIFDEPVGKTDGTVNNNGGKSSKRYFDAMPNYGGFIKPKNIKVGDYPERDIFDESDDDDEDEL